MSKNTGQSRFRKVDVDQFDEDKFQEENVEEDGEAGPNEGEINTLLSQYPLQALVARHKARQSFHLCDIFTDIRTHGGRFNRKDIIKFLFG